MSSLEAVTALVPFLRARHGPAVRGDLLAADLIADPDRLAAEIAATAGGRQSDDPQVLASLWWQAYSYRIAGTTLAAWVVAGSAPDPAAAAGGGVGVSRADRRRWSWDPTPPTSPTSTPSRVACSAVTSTRSPSRSAPATRSAAGSCGGTRRRRSLRASAPSPAPMAPHRTSASTSTPPPPRSRTAWPGWAPGSSPTAATGARPVACGGRLPPPTAPCARTARCEASEATEQPGRASAISPLGDGV